MLLEDSRVLMRVCSNLSFGVATKGLQLAEDFLLGMKRGNDHFIVRFRMKECPICGPAAGDQLL